MHRMGQGVRVRGKGQGARGWQGADVEGQGKRRARQSGGNQGRWAREKNGEAGGRAGGDQEGVLCRACAGRGAGGEGEEGRGL